jgi:hypothetical protein
VAGQSDDASIASNDPRATDEALRLLGLFFVNFSRYMSHLEHGLSRCIGISDARVNRTMWAVTGGMEEYGLRKAFFAATALVQDPSDEERKIRTALNKRCQDLATSRNDLAHGVWYLFSSTGVETDEGVAQVISYEPVLIRTSGRLNEEPSYRNAVTSRRDLEVLAQEAEDVALLVWEYISGLFFNSRDIPRVTDRLDVLDGVLVRRDLSGWKPGDQP